MGILEQTMRDKFIPTLKNNFYNQSPTVKRLNAAGRKKDYTGDRTIKWREVAKRHQAPVGFLGFSAVPNQPINPLETASLTIAQRAVPVGIPKDEMLLNKGGGEVKLLDILKTQMENANDTFLEDLSTGLFSDGTYAGTGGAYVGFRAAVNSDNTYAGLNRSTETWWAANKTTTPYTDENLKDQSSAGFFPGLLMTMLTNTTHAGDSANLIVMSKKLYNIYQLILSNNNLRFGNDGGDAAFKSSQLRGVEVIFDDFDPAKHVFFVNMKEVTLHTVPGADFDLDEENGTIWKTPTEQLAKVAHILWMGQMVVRKPWTHGVYTALGD